MRFISITVVALLGLPGTIFAQPATRPSTAPVTQRAVYEQDFQQVQMGKVPEEIKVLSGEFTIAAEQSNRFLELPPTPINSFAVLLGPEQDAAGAIRARIRSDNTGRRFPEFGIGLGGIGGYQLWLMPIVHEIQIRQGNKVLAQGNFQWKPGTWVHLKVEVKQVAAERWQISGKAWHEGMPELAQWNVQHDVTSAPPSGRASLWAVPYSEKPIQFDDVRIEGR